MAVHHLGGAGLPGDLDPVLADRTRERLWGELSDGRTLGVGAHFPELALGRVEAGRRLA